MKKKKKKGTEENGKWNADPLKSLDSLVQREEARRGSLDIPINRTINVLPTNALLERIIKRANPRVIGKLSRHLCFRYIRLPVSFDMFHLYGINSFHCSSFFAKRTPRRVSVGYSRKYSFPFNKRFLLAIGTSYRKRR